MKGTPRAKNTNGLELLVYTHSLRSALSLVATLVADARDGFSVDLQNWTDACTAIGRIKQIVTEIELVARASEEYQEKP